MIPEIRKEQVYSVKIYFINPVSILTVITDALIKLEFETYTVDLEDRAKLIHILDKNIRNVIFVCVLGDHEIDSWINYVHQLFRVENTFIQIGAFVFDSISNEKKFLFLERGIPVIPFSEIRNNTLDVIRKILYYFEATGKRKYIRTRASRGAEVFFDLEDSHKPIKGNVMDISAYAFSCRIFAMYAPFFSVGELYRNVVLLLKGARVNTNVQLIGISKVNPELYVFIYQRDIIVNKKSESKTGLNTENKNKVYKYIKLCLKENLKKQLDEVVGGIQGKI